jgi:hypothetical protein
VQKISAGNKRGKSDEGWSATRQTCSKTTHVENKEENVADKTLRKEV